jgi:hypothetical protein
MPASNPTANADGRATDIQMSVGQTLKVTKGSGWDGHSLSAPVTDNPSVLRLVQSTTGNLVATYLAVAPGIADIGGLSDACGGGSPPVDCFFGNVQVVP